MKEATASSFLPSFCPSTLHRLLYLSLSLVFFQGESFPPQGDAISYGISYGCQRIELSRGRECCLSSKMFPRVIPFSKCNRYKSRLTARFEQIWFDYVEEYFEFGILEYRSNIADIVILDSPDMKISFVQSFSRGSFKGYCSPFYKKSFLGRLKRYTVTI